MWKTLSPGDGDGAIFTVNGHESIAERRHYPRSGVVSRLEDIITAFYVNMSLSAKPLEN